MAPAPLEFAASLEFRAIDREPRPHPNRNANSNEQGTPVSKQFDDVYFSNQDGLEETRYVFLHGNRLPQRFATHPRPLLVVAETGFGTGLNFLTLWQAFAGFRRRAGRCTATPALYQL